MPNFITTILLSSLLFFSACDKKESPLTQVVDRVAPILTLNGNSTVQITIGDNYSDDGATATDNVDGDISSNIQTTSNVDTSTTGTYTVIYSVSDTAGNQAESITREVVVVDSSVTQSDNPYMMPYYTGVILPTPQTVLYNNEYLQLSNTAIILNNVPEDDARVRYLTQRITLYGGEYTFVNEANENHTCIIKINDDSLNPPQKEQGYVIKSNGKTVSLKGSDFQGLLWAISSLDQMIFTENGKTLLRTLEVTDWPKLQRRGILPEDVSNVKQFAHLMVAFKLNFVDFRASISKDKKHADDWRLSRSEVFHKNLSDIQKYLTSLGFEWYAGARFLGYDQVPQINCSSQTDFDYIYKNFALPIALAGGNLSVQFDDTRYPVHQKDIEKFGTAAAADSYLLNKLYDKLKADYPDIRIAFTPPYYWGPTAPSPLPESRDDYLNIIGDLPQAIDIYWTGPRVRSNVVSSEDIRWEEERIKRKPLIFQNGIGNPHDFDYHYVTDPIYSLNKWYYPEYLQNIKAYLLNGGNVRTSGVLASLADWTWNPEKFNPEVIIKDAVAKLAGDKAYPIFEDINVELSKFDTYLPDVTIRAILNSSVFYKALDKLEADDAKLDSLDNGKSIEFWTDINASHISGIRKFVKQLRTLSDDPVVKKLLKIDNATEAMYYALKEKDFDPASDIFLDPADFTGAGVFTYGYSNTDAGMLLEDRLIAYVTGVDTPLTKMSATFDLKQFPPSSDYQLIISGADDFLDAKCPIKITVNDTIIFEGDNPFSNKSWDIQTAVLSAATLQSHNTISIENIAKKGNFDAPPAFMLSYIIIRPSQ